MYRAFRTYLGWKKCVNLALPCIQTVTRALVGSRKKTHPFYTSNDSG